MRWMGRFRHRPTISRCAGSEMAQRDVGVWAGVSREGSGRTTRLSALRLVLTPKTLGVGQRRVVEWPRVLLQESDGRQGGMGRLAPTVRSRTSWWALADPHLVVKSEPGAAW